MVKIEVEKIATLTGHKDCIYTIQGTGKDAVFFSAAGDGMVVSWDMESLEHGKLLAKVPNSVYSICYIPEFDSLVIGQNYEGIHLINVSSRLETRSLKLSTAAIFEIVYHKGMLIIATGDGTLWFVDFATFEVKAKIKDSSKSARCIAVNEQNNEIAVGYSDYAVRIYDLSKLKIKYQLLNHKNSVFTVKYAPDFRFLLTGGRDAHINIHDVNAGYTLKDSIAAHMYAINYLEYSPDGNYFLSCSMDKSIKVWDAREFRLLKVIDKTRHAGHGTSVNRLFWSGFSQKIISCSDDKTISVWDLKFN